MVMEPSIATDINLDIVDGKHEKYDMKSEGSFEVIRNLDYKKCLEGQTVLSHTDGEVTNQCHSLLQVSSNNILPKTVLDLYLPKQKKETKTDILLLDEKCTGNRKRSGVGTPIVLFVHGGGWRRGHKQGWDHYLSKYDTNFLVYFLLRWFHVYDNIGESLARQGMACAIVAYPLSSLRLPWNLLEIFTSFLSTVGFLGVVISPFLLTVGLLCDNFCKTFKIPIYSYFIFVLGITQFVVWLTICFRKSFYGLSRRIIILQLCVLVMISVILVVCLPTAGKLLQIFHWISLMITIITQGTIIYLHVTLPSVVYEDQLNAVMDSALWLKNYGLKTNSFDPDMFYLMGHSAGGQLVTMATQESFLGKRSKTIQGIKGVISISGVYDLPALARGILSHFYVIPTFGADQVSWRAASPIHSIKNITASQNTHNSDEHQSSKLPPFFLISAKWDFSLLEQSNEFAEELCNAGVEVERLVVDRTDHFTITVCFGRKVSLEQKCAEFVWKTENML